VSRRAALAVLSLAVLTTPLSAQAPPQPGERIRVFASGGTWEGTFVALDSVAVLFVLRTGGAPQSVSLTTLARLEVQRGRRPATGRGAKIGALVGAAGGALLAAATYEECQPGVDPACFGIAVHVVGGLAVGGLIGAGAGAIVGAVVQQDAWVPINLRSLRIGATATPRGPGIELAFVY
jgi:hypothetical protein